MKSKMKKLLFFLFLLVFSILIISPAKIIFAYYHLNLIYQKDGPIEIEDVETFQIFYDELKGNPRTYYFHSDKDFDLKFFILVPVPENSKGRYSAKIFANGEEKGFFDGSLATWDFFYDSFLRNYCIKSSGYKQKLPAGSYRIEIFSSNSPDNTDNKGKYILAIGNKKVYDLKALSRIYWQVPILKIHFFNSNYIDLLFSFWGISFAAGAGVILILLFWFYYLIGLIKKIIQQKRNRTLLLTSDASQMKEEIKNLLGKPAYNVNLAFLYTGSLEDKLIRKDLKMLREEMGFNVGEVNIDNITAPKLQRLIEYRDIIFVADGNPIYLLEVMKKCNFKKIIEKMLKEGKVYIGSGGGSVVAGKRIITALYGAPKKGVKKFLKGLKLVPFEVYVHYKPEDFSLIQKIIPSKRQRKKIKILTDEQALLIQGKTRAIIGRGAVIVL